MGKLVDGVWHDVWYDTKSTGGKFERSETQFRNWITPDGSPGESGSGGFAAEKNRYHLFVSLACPWAHRTLIFRQLKGLLDCISVSVVHHFMGEHGWTFADGPGVIGDPIIGADYLHQVYTHADPSYSGRVTVPVLWDRKTNAMVNNESSEIIRMFGSAFDGIVGDQAKVLDLYPEALRADIDRVNARVYDDINNGVYKCGFATDQSAYEDAFEKLFDSLDWAEALLEETPYLCGDTLTEADWRLFTTLIRFDAVYVGHFKCNKRRIADYPNLSRLTRQLYAMPGIAATVDFLHIKKHYYGSHSSINPTGIVPVGPDLDLRSRD